MSSIEVAPFLEVLERGSLVAIADGAGMPSTAVLGALCEAARLIGDVNLLLGWCIGARPGLDFAAFNSVRTTLGGYALQDAIQSGRVEYVPARLGTMPTLLAGPLRPDVYLGAMAPRAGNLAFGSEVGWAAAAMKYASFILIEENGALPISSAVADLPRAAALVVGHSMKKPDVLKRPVLSEAAKRIGRAVASLVLEGSAVQIGPGSIGEAVLGALEVPVSIDSGIVVDAVVDLESRGLLLGAPRGAYIAGSPSLYKWANGRPIVRGVDDVLNFSRLSAQTLFAVNTALEIDMAGQINVESVAGRSIAGIGGLADFALSASRSEGLSIIALPTKRGGNRTLVDSLESPTSTSRTDVDVVVTELGMADLRGLSDSKRRRALLEIW